ncbi:MAG: hypothetical protein HUK25_03740, partial [Treponema sp.]|nr:hypothetical protein [Treponema sp.]
LGTDGEKTINVTLVKYSGLSNDYNERVYGIQKESGKLTRQVANRYTSSNYSRDTDYFKVNRTNKITVDTTPPSVSYTLGSPFEDHTYSSSAPYSVTSTSSRQILVFSKAFGATSSNITQDIPLSSLGITDSSASTFKFYSNDTCSTEIEKVTFTQTRTKSGGKYTYQTPTAIPSSVWTKDAVGNKTQITLTAKSLSELDSATDGVYFAYGSVDTSLNLEIQTAQYAEGVTDGVKTLSTGGTGSEIFTKNDTTTLKLIPSNVQSMNIEVSTGGTNLGSDKVQTVNNAYVNVSVESGKQYKVKVISKAVSTVYSEYNITVTKDTEAPVLNAPEFTIEKVLDVNNGNAELTAGEGYYFDS